MKRKKTVTEMAGNIGGRLLPGAEERKDWKELVRLARIGEAVETLPPNHGLFRAEPLTDTWLILHHTRFLRVSNDYACKYVPFTEDKSIVKAFEGFERYKQKRPELYLVKP